MVYGNFVPKAEKDSFFSELLKKLSADTKFRIGVPVSPDELDEFCCRFHGTQSVKFEESLLEPIDWPMH